MNPKIKLTELQEFKLELGFNIIREVMNDLDLDKLISHDKKLMVTEFEVMK